MTIARDGSRPGPLRIAFRPRPRHRRIAAIVASSRVVLLASAAVTWCRWLLVNFSPVPAIRHSPAVSQSLSHRYHDRAPQSSLTIRDDLAVVHVCSPLRTLTPVFDFDLDLDSYPGLSHLVSFRAPSSAQPTLIAFARSRFTHQRDATAPNVPLRRSIDSHSSSSCRISPCLDACACDSVRAGSSIPTLWVAD